MPLAIAIPSAAAPLRRPHHFRFLQPSRKLTLSRTRCAPSPPAEAQPVPPQPRRYPRQYPGEAVGVAEEMRFVAMRLRNTKRTTRKGNNRADGAEEDDESKEEEVEDNDEMDEEGNAEVKEEEEEDNHEVEEWMPSMEGFVRYLVDSKLVFDTVERIIAGSTDVAYVYFRKSGLERSASIEKDLEWYREQAIEIPEPSTFGTTYAAYLSELAGSSAPAFLSHYYNIYFSHTTGGLVIGKKILQFKKNLNTQFSNPRSATDSWPAKSLLLEIVLGVHISWRWHLLKDGIDPCRSGRHELVSVHASLVNVLDRNLMLPWDPGGSRYVCWVLNNKQFAGIIKVSFMNMLLDLNGNALVDAMADIGKLSTFIQLAQQSVNLLVINELGNCTFVLLYAMSTFTTYLGNSGIGVARHVFNNMPAWRRNAFSPGHSAIRGDHLLLESIQSRGRSAFSLSQYGIGGVQYVVDKLPSLSRNAFSLGNSVMQASPAMWFSFFSQCHTTQFSARNWDPGIALTKSKEQLTILILQWFRFSTWLMLLWGGWPNGGRNYSLYQLLGHNF